METREPHDELESPVISELSHVVSNAFYGVTEQDTRQLRLVSTIQSPPSDDTEAPYVDIIHVNGFDSKRQLTLETILGDTATSRTRVFVFQCDIPSLLLKDTVLGAAHNQAVQLLDDLVSFSEDSENGSQSAHPVRIFVAYDLGSLIVNKAIAIASRSEERWPGVFYSAVQFIYFNCFLRWRRHYDIEAELWHSLMDDLKEAPLAPLITPASISALIDAVIETTEALLASRITLRTRIVSIYDTEADEEEDEDDDTDANTNKETDEETDEELEQRSEEGSSKGSDEEDEELEEEGEGDGTMEEGMGRETDQNTRRFISTFGVSTEIAMTADLHGPTIIVPSLSDIVCYRKQNWVNSPEWVELQRMLLPLSQPQHQHAAEEPESTNPILQSRTYNDWVQGSKSPVLYIQGQYEEQSRLLAEQALLHWQSVRQDKEQYQTPVLSFSFSSDDPRRADMYSMICSATIQVFSAFGAERDQTTARFRDLHKIHRGWTFQHLRGFYLSLVCADLATGGLLVLHNVDECEYASRTAFWDLLQRSAELSDLYARVIVTSRRRLSLLADSDATRLWYVYDHAETGPKEVTAAPSRLVPGRLVSRLCPGGYGETQVRKSLRSLKSMKKTVLDQIIRLIKTHTNWPNDPSFRSWIEFSTLLNQVQPSSTPVSVLDGILRSIPDQTRLRWILQWLIHGHRPLSVTELTCVLHNFDRSGDRQIGLSPTPDEVEDSRQILKSWLPALVHIGTDQVCLRKTVRDMLLEDDPAYMWNEIKPVAHETMLEFLTEYLTSSKVLDHLNELYNQYVLLGYTEVDRLAPSLQPDGKDFVYYAITAFPYHLQRTPSAWKHLDELFNPEENHLVPWARMYWAMSNPFSRLPVQKADSPLSLLLNARSIDPDFRRALKRVMTSSDFRQKSPSDDFTPLNAVGRALSNADEKAALKHIHRILGTNIGPLESADETSTPTQVAARNDTWPSQILWRAACLDMSQLADYLLDTVGVSPDAKGVVSQRYASPLLLASALGYPRIVQSLLRAGADPHALLNGNNTLFVAAVNGHVDIVRALVNHDRTLIDIKTPNALLYGGSHCGNWLVVKALLELGVPSEFVPGSDGGLPPIVIAAYSGYVRTVRALLEGGVDPNAGVPGGQRTALWSASLYAQSIGCVQALLEHGADPNHQLLNPPLVVEICRSSNLESDFKIALLKVLLSSPAPFDVDRVDLHGTTALIWASSSGYTPVVEWLLDHGASVNALNNRQCGAMHYAVVNNHVEVVQRLLERKPPLDVVTSDGQTLLQVSVKHGPDLVRMLLDAGADPEQQDGDGLTVINMAVLQQEPDVVALLIERKVDLYHRDPAGWCPFHDAAGHEPDEEILRLFAEAGVNLKEPTPTGQTPLHLAASYPEPDIVAVLLEYRGGLDIEQRNDGGETPLIEAAASGNVECMRRLIRAGADINAQTMIGLTPLMSAVGSSNATAAVTFLLSQPGIDETVSSKTSGTALHIACAELEIEVVKMLLGRGADVNLLQPGNRPTPLMAACMPSSMLEDETRDQYVDQIDQVVRLLVDRGADMHGTYRTPTSTVLCSAAARAAARTINYLVSKGLSLKQPNCLNRLPIHYAAINGRENFDVVFQTDGDLVSRDIAGKNALHWAAQFGHVQTVESILAHARTPEERRHRINEPDADGWTALCWALRPLDVGNGGDFSESYDPIQTVRVLIEGGADMDISCRMGAEDETFTVLELAKLHNVSDEIMACLIGARPETETEALQNGDEVERDHNDAKDDAEDANGTTATRSIRPYKVHEYTCYICLNTIWGPVYACGTCPDFHACKKCYGRIDLYHELLKQETDDNDNEKVNDKDKDSAEATDHEAIDDASDVVENHDNDNESETKNKPLTAAQHIFRLIAPAEPEISSPQDGPFSSPGHSRKGSEGDSPGSHGQNENGSVADTMEAIMNFSVDDDVTEIDDGASLRFRSP